VGIASSLLRSPPGTKKAAIRMQNESRAVQKPAAVSGEMPSSTRPVVAEGRTYRSQPAGTVDNTKKTINVPWMVRYAR